MSIVTSSLVIVLAGALGAYSFQRLRLPAAEINGPLVLVSAAMLMGVPSPEVPLWLGIAPQMVIGAYLGQRLDREMMRKLRTMAVPALLVALWAVAAAFGIGLLVSRVSGLDYTTSVLSSCASGLVEISAIAVAFQVQAPIVVLFHLFRFFVLIVSVPALIAYLGRRFGEPPLVRDVAATRQPAPISRKARCGRERPRSPAPWAQALPAWLLCLAVGTVGAVTAWHLNVPVPGVTGAFFLVAALRLACVDLEPPAPGVNLSAKVGLGILVGMSFTREVVSGMLGLLLPALAMTVILLVTGILLGFLVRRITGWDLVGSLLCCAPVGLVQMAIVAESFGTDPVRVSLLSLVRLLAIIIVVPLVLTFLPE